MKWILLSLLYGFWNLMAIFQTFIHKAWLTHLFYWKKKEWNLMIPCKNKQKRLLRQGRIGRSKVYIYGLFNNKSYCWINLIRRYHFSFLQTGSKCYCYPNVTIRETLLTHFELNITLDQVTKKLSKTDKIFICITFRRKACFVIEWIHRFSSFCSIRYNLQ